MAKIPTQKVVSKKSLARIEREKIQKKYLFIGLLIVVVLVVGFISYGLIDEYLLKPTKPVAKVNNEKISVNEFQANVKFARYQLIQQYQGSMQIYQMFATNPEISANFESSLRQIKNQLSPQFSYLLGNQILDDMINNKLIKQKAKEFGLTVSDQDIDKEFQTAFYYFPAGTPTPESTATSINTSTFSPTQLAIITLTPTPAKMSEEDLITETTDLASENTNDINDIADSPPTATATEYTYAGYQEQYKKYIEQVMEIGISEKDFKNIVSTQLISNKVFIHITKDLQPEEEQVWARHILVVDSEKAKEVINKLNAGEDWATLAAEYSQDTSNKEKGGDLGWFGTGVMVKNFEDAAFSMEIGEVSQPIETEFGLHIIQVLGHELRQLNSSELQTYQQKIFNDWLESIKAESSVEKSDNWQDFIPLEPNIPAELDIFQ